MLTCASAHDILSIRNALEHKEEEMKMKNVMLKAWKIAKDAVLKFGGSAKEYFVEALRMAWKEIKKGATTLLENFGFTEIKKVNGTLYFAVDNIDGLTVSFIYQEISNKTGKACKKKKELGYQTGRNNKLDKPVRIYSVGITDTELELQCGDEVRTLKIDRGLLQWS